MKATLTSHHAEVRAQQRAIKPEILDILLDYGQSVRAGEKADIYLLTKRERRMLKRAIGDEGYRRVEHKLDCYAVIARGGEVITVGHRIRRFKRDYSPRHAARLDERSFMKMD